MSQKILVVYQNMGGIHTTLSTLVHIHMSAWHMLKGIHIVQENIYWCLSPIIMKNKSVRFLMKVVEMSNKFSLMSSSFIVIVLTSKCNFLSKCIYKYPNTMIQCNLGNKTDHIQSHYYYFMSCQNLIFLSSDVSMWVFHNDSFKISIHCFWKLFSLSICELAQFSILKKAFLINQIWDNIWCCATFSHKFLHRIHSQQFFTPSLFNLNSLSCF